MSLSRRYFLSFAALALVSVMLTPPPVSFPNTNTRSVLGFTGFLNEKMMENVKQNRDTLLIIDEAQLLTEENLEELRLLQNFQLNDRQLLTVVLVGQTELRNRIRNLEQLDQRIPIKYHLEPFDLDDTVRYISFRQEKAGGKENLFDTEAMERIYDHSKGVARQINHLCDLALLFGFNKKEENITEETIESILNDGALC